MNIPHYLDFDLQIEEVADGHFRARVLASPAGQAEALFDLPFSPLEIENFLLRMARPRRMVRRINSPALNEARTFGEKLYNAVFQGGVQNCLLRSIDYAEQRGQGIRLRLRLPPALVELSWEYLYDPTHQRFLVHSVNTPIVRYVDLPQSLKPFAVTPPLNVLVMIANPSDYELLDVESEWQKIKAAVSGLEQSGLLQLTRLSSATRTPGSHSGATLAALQRQLRREPYHIFHFIGHGGFDQQTQDGVLLLEAEDGRSRLVSGDYLGALLHDHPSLRLAVLNACEGARTSKSDPFAGVAQQLVRQGIPAVVAMQFEITDIAAGQLAREFYDALASGYPVDGALAEARKALFTAGNEIEWGTPVLYLRAADGQLFDVAAQPAKDAAWTDKPRVEETAQVDQVVGTPEQTVTVLTGATARRWPWGILSSALVLIIGGIFLWQAFFRNSHRTPTPAITQSGETSSPTASIAQPAADPAEIDAAYVFVPAGTFVMGLDEGGFDEKPAHEVYLDAFWIMQTEVTNEQYEKCVEAGSCTPPANPEWGTSLFWAAYDTHPITYVTWEQAVTYAKWAGGRLPTEAEWEKAARGADEYPYPWGNQPPTDERLNFDNHIGEPQPVGSYPDSASPYGAQDMAGNVWEWTADWYAAEYYQFSPDENPLGPRAGERRVLRGGAYDSPASDVAAYYRGGAEVTYYAGHIGFRVVSESPPN